MTLQKLRHASLNELRVRASQRVAAFSERRGWSTLVKLPTDKAFLALLHPGELKTIYDLLEHFRLRSTPAFFPGFQNQEKIVGELKSRWPETARRLVEKADRICDGRFDLLGLTDLSFGDPIDWHFEPTTGKRIPLLHWSKLNYLDAEIAGDKKITWELNRHQYFMILGQAYCLTGNELYARVFTDHLEAWMKANPPKLGINWASSLEVAFRSIAWLWAFNFFKSSPSLSTETFIRASKFLYLSARHLESYLSTYFSPNTHLTGEALGLFYLGTLLPEFKEAKRWQRLGSQILLEQLPVHVKRDGVYFEQSSYYHRYTTDFYIHFSLLSRVNNLKLPSEVEQSLVLLLDHLMYITRPDGTTPFLGDDDGGRLVMLDTRPANDFRSSLSTGAALFDRGDYKLVSGGAAEETLWLLGAEGLRRFDQLEPQKPGKESVEFREGGYYVMRDGWSEKSNYLLFDCGPHGILNCGHAHADALAIDVAANGRTLLVDPGTFTYTGAREMRDWFRSSAAHNTLTVERHSSSIPADTFSWKTITACERLAWIEHPRFTFAAGRHRGYEQLSRPGIHTRSILFLKGDYWLVRDRVELAGKHQVDLWFHFDSGTSPVVHDGAVHENGVKIASFATGGHWTKEEGWVSHCYGERAAAPVCVFTAAADGAFEIITFLVPGGPERSIEEIEVSGGRGFEIRSEHSRDVVIVKDDGEARTASLISDFEYTWLRFAGANTTPEEVVLLGGRRLELAGEKIVESPERVEYVLKNSA